MDEPHPSRLLEAVADLTTWFKDQAVSGAVIGGLAASLLGRPRVTKDVDAVVLLKGANLETFLMAASRFGFVPRIGDAAAFAVKSRVLLLLHEPTKTPVDVSLGALPFEEESVDRASIITVAGLSFPVISPEDLIIMKSLPRRPRDIADIEGLLDAHPELDLNRVRYWVSEFASVLESPEILDDVERILKNWKRRSI